MTIDFEAFIADQIKSRPTEATIVRKAVRALKAAGVPVVAVWDTVERVEVKTEEDILKEVFNLDEAFLVTQSGAWVRLTMGNEYDIITDYTTDLEAALQPALEWIDKHQ